MCTSIVLINLNSIKLFLDLQVVGGHGLHIEIVIVCLYNLLLLFRCPSSERVWFTRLTKRLAKFELIAETLHSSSRRKHIFNFNCLISDFVFYPVSKHFKQYILKKHWTTHSLLILPEYVWYVYLHVSLHVLYCKWFVLIIPLLWIMIVYSTTVIAKVKKCRGHL